MKFRTFKNFTTKINRRKPLSPTSPFLLAKSHILFSFARLHLLRTPILFLSPPPTSTKQQPKSPHHQIWPKNSSTAMTTPSPTPFSSPLASEKNFDNHTYFLYDFKSIGCSCTDFVCSEFYITLTNKFGCFEFHQHLVLLSIFSNKFYVERGIENEGGLLFFANPTSRIPHSISSRSLSFSDLQIINVVTFWQPILLISY